MIINEYNKNTILKGKMKRGFNQTPKELKEKLNGLNIDVKEKPNDKNTDNKEINNKPLNIQNTLNKLRRLDK